MNKQLQQVEQFVERQESVAAGYITRALQRELRIICNDRLKPGRKVAFRDVMGLLDVTICTDKGVHLFESWGGPVTSRRFTVRTRPDPTFELGKEIGRLLSGYIELTDHRQFVANEFEFTTGE